MKRASPARLLTAALIIGGVLRLGAAWFYARTPLSSGGDDVQYHELADNLEYGRGYLLDGRPSAYRAPLYPLWLAGVMAVSGSRAPGFARFAQALLSLLTIWVAYRIGRELHSERAGAWAALLLALCPEQILLPTSLYCESVYALLVLLVAWALVRLRKKPETASAAWAGAALGLSLLMRSTLALVPLFFAPRKLKQVLLLLACAVLPLTPWIARNALRFGKLIPFESGVAGPVIWYASQGDIFAPGDETSVEPMKSMYAGLPPTEWDSFALRLARQEIAAHPIRYVKTSLQRTFALWTDSYTCYLLHDHQDLAGYMEAGNHWSRVYWPDMALKLALALLAGLGCWLERKRAGVLAVACLILYFNVYALGTVFARFAAPITPLFCVLAGLGLVAAFEAGVSRAARLR